MLAELLHPVVSLARISKTYRAGVPGCESRVRALHDLSLDVGAGELVTVAGATRTGKTTLLLCAAGMLRPDSGDVRWPSLAVRVGRAPAGIAYVADRAPVYNFLTVREALAYAATVHELYRPRATVAERELIDTCGLAAVADTRLGLLPTAERARLMLALALVASPRLVLIDDVSVGIDSAGHDAFADCLSRIARAGAAILYAARAPVAAAGVTAALALVDGTLRPEAARRAPARSAPAPTLGVPTVVTPPPHTSVPPSVPRPPRA